MRIAIVPTFSPRWLPSTRTDDQRDTPASTQRNWRRARRAGLGRNLLIGGRTDFLAGHPLGPASSVPKSVESFSTITDWISQPGRMRSAHKPATVRLERRRLGERVR